VLHLLSLFKPKLILEIGMYLGGTMELWSKAFQPEVLIGVDIAQKSPKVIEIVKPNYHYLWNMNSTNLATVGKVKEILGDRKVDFLFIDGDHHKLVVESDWQLFSPLVRQGGVIGFHDVCYQGPEEEVYLFWPQMKKLFPYIELKSLTASTGWGLVFV
ncbi:MAG: class I SAM-dependent methyltransferase, partial [Candidatus Roizmanbacteria bacterium]|nr:class I SAM-dependent methyltransferase [Candidatus Roizmanbacteria bacterium]